LHQLNFEMVHSYRSFIRSAVIFGSGAGSANMRSRGVSLNVVHSTEASVADSILEAIRDGQWDYEPDPVTEDRYDSTHALPGSADKVKELAFRVRHGLPLWHSGDRRYYDETEEALK
jgi:urease gamma subunit